MSDEEIINFAVLSIRQYLAAHRYSADTAEGIHLWWISWPDVQESTIVTTEALARLEKFGEIERVDVGNRRLWRQRRT
jgi:hypothetical protein